MARHTSEVDVLKRYPMKNYFEEEEDLLAQFGDYYAMTPEERFEKSKGLFNEGNDKTWRG
jgi:hypothetical protein